MKNLLLSFIAFALGCSGSSQKPTEIVIVNKELKHPFFDQQSIFAQSGSDTIFYDSVRVDVNDNFAIGDRISNAFISSNGKIFPLDTCNGFFKGDTAIIKFRTVSRFVKNEFSLIISGKKVFSKYDDHKFGRDYESDVQKLELDREIDKSKGLIKGIIEFRLVDKSSKEEYFLKGPFYCILE